jgi:hypothetical protein
MLSTSCLSRLAVASSSDCEEAAAEPTAAATANMATVNGCSRRVTPGHRNRFALSDYVLLRLASIGGSLALVSAAIDPMTALRYE